MPNFEEAEFANEKEKLISFYKAPNETEFLIHLQQLVKEYNGTLPGDSELKKSRKSEIMNSTTPSMIIAKMLITEPRFWNIFRKWKFVKNFEYEQK